VKFTRIHICSKSIDLLLRTRGEMGPLILKRWYCRGLVAGVLPTYCVSCTDLISADNCQSHRSCEWDISVRDTLVQFLGSFLSCLSSSADSFDVDFVRRIHPACSTRQSGRYMFHSPRFCCVLSPVSPMSGYLFFPLAIHLVCAGFRFTPNALQKS
jgi:hypothetical protein